MPKASSRELVILGSPAPVPAIVSTAGTTGGKKFIEFFTAEIRNPNTRAAYYRAVMAFFSWIEACGFHDLATIEPFHVATYIEELGKTHAKPSVKQHLAAIRMLFDYLVIGQVVPMNPASSVRGPRYVLKKGKTPILSGEETRQLLASLRTDTVVGLRDRALIGVLLLSFARVSAAIHMKVGDYFPQGKRWWLRLHEKGGKHHEMPAHHLLEEYLDAYLDAAGIGDDKKGPLFRTAKGRTGALTRTPLPRENAYHMINRRVKDSGIKTKIGCHTFRGTGITLYLLNGGSLEHAQQMAAHESPRTTKLYDRTKDEISLDEVERIVF
jgi:site-specific recombinase XerD